MTKPFGELRMKNGMTVEEWSQTPEAKAQTARLEQLIEENKEVLDRLREGGD